MAEPALPLGFATETSSIQTVPALGLTKPSITPSNVDLPQPLRPTSATTSLLPNPKEVGAGAQVSTVGAPDTDILHGNELDRCAHRVGGARRGGIIEEVQDPPADRPALGGGVIAGAERAQWLEGFGGEQQDDQRDLQFDAAADEAQPDLDGHDGHRQARKQFEHERREERQPQHPHGGSAILVRHRLHCPALRARPSEYPKSRQTVDDVKEMIGHALQRSPLVVGAALGRQSGKHHEEQDNGEGQHEHHP